MDASISIESRPFEACASTPTLPDFNESIARRLGEMAANIAVRRGLPIAVSVVSQRSPLFYCTLDGNRTEDSESIRRKQNTVFRFRKSSHDVGRMFAQAGWSLESQGLSARDYALDGGSVPLSLVDTGIVGVMTVTGLDCARNHELAVEIVRCYLDEAGPDFARD